MSKRNLEELILKNLKQNSGEVWIDPSHYNNYLHKKFRIEDQLVFFNENGVLV